MGRFFKHLFISLAAFIVSALIFCIAIVVVIAISLASFSPTAEPLKRGTVLEINMNDSYVDSPQTPSLADLKELAYGTTSKVSTLDMLRALELAAVDSNITAISLRMDGAESLPLAMAEELRDALIKFKETSQKPIYAYAESYSQSEYYLASVADKIFVHPLGQIEWQGVAMNVLFWGDLISRAGAEVEIFRPEECRYKSAVEPYSRGSMSDESRAQSRRLVNTLWDGVVGQVSQSRGITPETLREVAAHQIVVGANEALRLTMVDEIAYQNSYVEALDEIGVVVKEGSARRISFAKYAANMISENDISSLGGGDKIAIIYVDGTIVDGTSQPGGGMSNNVVGSTTIVKQLREARFDDDIKGVVLRVNSPGGSAMAADVMWREVELLKAEKMVVVSMGSYAASGGYYISAPADAIIADRYTLTGSIGVYGMMVSYAETLSRNFHINIDGVGSEPSADFGRVPRAITPLERAAMMRGVDQVYESFTTKVSKGRNLPIGVVHALSGGQVWSGIEAESCGLVDGVGGLNIAINLLVERCGLKSGEFEIVEITELPDEFEALLMSLGAHVKSLESTSLWSLLNLDRSQIESDLRLLQGDDKVLLHTSERLEF